jgi:integrase
LRLLLYTGCRANEIACLRWSEVPDDRVVLPAERVKNKRSHLLPVTREMRAVLERCERQPGRDNIFGRLPGSPFGGWNESKRRLDERCARRVPSWRPGAFMTCAEPGPPIWRTRRASGYR